MKTCTKCKVEKPATLEFFKPHTSTKSGLSSWCRQCTSEYSKTPKGRSNVYKGIKKYSTTLKGKTALKKSEKKYNYKKQGIYEWYDGDISLYIGQSKQLLKRINKHKTCFNNPENYKHQKQYHLYLLLNQHINASIRIIEECSSEVLLQREQHYINNLKPLYNKK
jgi:hypothetical protein